MWLSLYVCIILLSSLPVSKGKGESVIRFLKTDTQSFSRFENSNCWFQLHVEGPINKTRFSFALKCVMR